MLFWPKNNSSTEKRFLDAAEKKSSDWKIKYFLLLFVKTDCNLERFSENKNWGHLILNKAHSGLKKSREERKKMKWFDELGSVSLFFISLLSINHFSNKASTEPYDDDESCKVSQGLHLRCFLLPIFLFCCVCWTCQIRLGDNAKKPA